MGTYLSSSSLQFSGWNPVILKLTKLLLDIQWIGVKMEPLPGWIMIKKKFKNPHIPPILANCRLSPQLEIQVLALNRLKNFDWVKRSHSMYYWNEWKDIFSANFIIFNLLKMPATS